MSAVHGRLNVDRGKMFMADSTDVIITKQVPHQFLTYHVENSLFITSNICVR